MSGQLLGIIQNILNGLSSLIFDILGGLIKVVFELVFDWVLAPVLMAIIEFIKYMIAGVMYRIAIFLLQLVDLMEMFFRGFVGLEPTGTRSAEFSLDGESGDLLVQVIRHEGIQEAFIAMCVVGLFLLVVTTVFQVIKTEYTTEGAKNAKGPIYQKAFKGLANLMLLPILVVFGVIFANQLLGLLDKATKVDGDNPTISGLIFVSSASEAHMRNDDLVLNTMLAVEMVGAGGVAAITPTVAAVEVAVQTLVENIAGTFGNDLNWEFSYVYSESEQEAIESNFIDQKAGYRYYNPIEALQYYNIANVNWFLLIAGSCVVLKSLFYITFGLVIRLYKCAMLFIIAPAVIGLTPVNEGGLGKWRTAFIGQVLSAYGTVMALNLFFVIVRVLISIDITFKSMTFGQETSGAFTSTLMTGIFKIIVVISGTLLIESFAKDIGGYFGADDGLAAGKDMSKKVGEEVKKGVTTAAAVAATAALTIGTGGAGAGAGSLVSGLLKGGGAAAKAVGGIAGKVGGKAAAVVSKLPGGSKIVSGASKIAKAPKKAQNFLKDKALGAVDEKTGKRKGGALSWVQDILPVSDEKKKYLSTMDDIDKLTSNKEKYENEIKKSDQSIKWNERQIVKTDAQMAELRKQGVGEEDSRYQALQNHKKELENDIVIEKGKKASNQMEIDAYDKKIADKYADVEPYAKKKQASEASKMAMIAGLVGLAEDGKKNLPGAKLFDMWSKAQDTGGKVMGDSYEAAVKSTKYLKEKAVQDYYHDTNPITKGLAAEQNMYGAVVATSQIVKEAKFMNARIETSGNDELRNLSQTLKNLPQEFHAQQIEATRLRMQQMGIDLEHNQVKEMALKLDNNPQMEFKLNDFKVDFDPNKIQAAVLEAMKNGGNTPEAIQEAVKKVFADIASTGNAPLMKMLTDVITKVMNDTPK